MAKIALELESNWVNVLRPLADRPLDSFIKELVVLELYRRHLISAGKAAELLEMERFEFVRYASRLGIPFFDMSEAEMTEEIDHLNML
jgi:predicted HTH domain antitoxin